jgi:hypothetical protein
LSALPGRLMMPVEAAALMAKRLCPEIVALEAPGVIPGGFTGPGPDGRCGGGLASEVKTVIRVGRLSG